VSQCPSQSKCLKAAITAHAGTRTPLQTAALLRSAHIYFHAASGGSAPYSGVVNGKRRKTNG
jgi:hypothetical protein